MTQTAALPAIGPVTPAELALAQRQQGWTELRVSVALRKWNAGLSDAQVACLIGGGISRNAVIGMRDRYGHKAATTILRPKSVHAGTPQPRAPRLPRLLTVPSGPRISRAPKPPRAPDIRDNEIGVEQRRTLLQLEENCCHWPVGDPSQPGFFFCGAVVHRRDDNKFDSYCASHMRRAHLSEPARRVIHREGPDRRPNF